MPAAPTPKEDLSRPINDMQVSAVETRRRSYLTADRDVNLANDDKDEKGRYHRPMLTLPGEVTIKMGEGAIDRLQARAEAKGKKFSDVGLVLNGVYIKGTHPRRYQVAMDPQDVLHYTLAYSDESGAAINRLLTEQGFAGIMVSLGFEDGETMRSESFIDILPSLMSLIASAALALLLVIAFLWMVRRTTMLREPGHGYSLGRTQMAWWTLLAIWAFLFLYHFAGALEMTKSVVILMGISSATALAAMFIDQRKVEGRPGVDAPALPTSRPPAGSYAQVPFVRSLLADPADPHGGLSLNRAQVVVWTLVMSYVFLDSVIGRFVMPEFDNTMLALMGVSSGTYLGFKIPEKQAGDAASGEEHAAALVPSPAAAPEPAPEQPAR